MKNTITFVLGCVLSLGMVWGQNSEMVSIPGGSFNVVDGVSQIPVIVRVSEFKISRTEITQKQYTAVMGKNPSYHPGDDLPVENVTWWDAIQYCNKRSEAEKLEPCYDLATGQCDLTKRGYRLPTDTEWQLASAGVTKLTEAQAKDQANVGRVNTTSTEQLLADLQNTGTKPVGSYPPNGYGLCDMLGNVWEWCNDYFTPVKDYYIPIRNPIGPEWGVARVVRGGGFITPVMSWSTGSDFKFSKEPNYKSRFLGFRVCRSLANRALPAEPYGSKDWLAKYQDAPADFKNNTGELSDFLKDDQGAAITSLDAWQAKRQQIIKKWSDLMGYPPIEKPPINVKEVKSFDEDLYTAKMLYLQLEPDYWEKILVMIPKHPIRTPTPAVIVPFYDVDPSAGKAMGGARTNPPGIQSYAYLMVQQGFVAVAAKYFEIGYGEGLNEAVANQKLKYPHWTGLGKWVWDSHRILDYIETLPYVDQKRIGIIGHSLGGKMAFYAAAFDSRIAAAVSSEPGVGLSFSNYEDFWYYGDFIKNVDKATDHHEVLALIAPRPFMLIAGDKYDTDKSWYYINAARKAYDLYGISDHIGLINHRKGHPPTPNAVRDAVEWLTYFLTKN